LEAQDPDAAQAEQQLRSQMQQEARDSIDALRQKHRREKLRSNESDDDDEDDDNDVEIIYAP